MFLVGWVFCFRSKSLQFLAVKNEYINKWGTCPECAHKFFYGNRRKSLKKETGQKSYHYLNVSAACNCGISLIYQDSDIQKLGSN